MHEEEEEKGGTKGWQEPGEASKGVKHQGLRRRESLKRG